MLGPYLAWMFLADRSPSKSGAWHRKSTVIAALSLVAITSHLVLRAGFHAPPGTSVIPLLATLSLGGCRFSMTAADVDCAVISVDPL